MKSCRTSVFILIILAFFACKEDVDPKREIEITSPEYIDGLLLVKSDDYQIETSESATFSSNDPHVKITSTGLINRITSGEVTPIDIISADDAEIKITIYALGVKDDNYDPPNAYFNGTPGTDPYDSYLKGWKTLQKLPIETETYAIILRHADADNGMDWNIKHSGNGPEDWWKSCDPTLARQLNAQGKQRAAELGKIFKDLNFPITRVISSEFCRAKETASLIDAGPTIVTDDRINHLDHNVHNFGGIFPGMIQIMKEQPVDNKITLITSHHPINELRDVVMPTFPSVSPFPWTGGYFIKIQPDYTITYEGAFSWGMFNYWRDKKLNRL